MSVSQSDQDTPEKAKVYEVHQTHPIYVSGGEFETCHRHLVTLWEKAHAELFASVIDSLEPKDHRAVVTEVDILIADEEAYYATGEQPIHLDLIALSPGEAVEIIALGKQ